MPDDKTTKLLVATAAAFAAGAMYAFLARPKLPTPDDVTKKLRTEAMKKDSPDGFARWLGALDKKLETSKTGYFVGGRLTIADLAVYRRLRWLQMGILDHIPKTILTDLGLNNLKKHFDMVNKHPKVTEWYSLKKEGTTKYPGSIDKDIVVTYFHFEGAAEKVRLAAYIGDVAFTDVRFKRGAWKDLKKDRAKFPNGQVPTMTLSTVDGIVTESSAMLRYVGKLGGLYPSDNDTEALLIDSVVGLVDDVYRSVISPTMGVAGKMKKYGAI